MAQKETILGNYTNFPRFPLDCESMEYIQNNTKLLAVIAQIAGCDKLIIKGCTGNSQSRTEGYVYVRTGDDLVGEILYYPGGSGVRCGISTDNNNNIDATANGENFANAYTKRKLVSGTTGPWAWSEFQPLSEITNAALKAAVDSKAASNHNHDTAYAAKNHTHDTAYAPKSHTHDDRYYTETEMDSKLVLKAAANHNHDTVYSKLSHKHDTAYAPKSHNHSISEVINLQSTLDGKAAAGHNHDTAYAAKIHNHDDRYYTEAEINSKISSTKDYADNLVAVQTGTALSYPNLFTIKKIGKIVYVAFQELDGSPDYDNYENGATQHRTLGIVIPEGFRPSTTVFGIGICSNSSISTDYIGNRPQFWIETSGKLSWFNPNERASNIHGNICYITN